MNKLLIIALFAAALSMAGCKKDDGTGTPQPEPIYWTRFEGCAPLSAQDSTAGITVEPILTTIAYDEHRRISLITEKSTSGGTAFHRYTYRGKTAEEKITFLNSSGNEETYYLSFRYHYGEHGLASSRVQLWSGQFSDSIVFRHTPDGHLKTVVRWSRNMNTGQLEIRTHYLYTIENGNITSIKDSLSGQVAATFEFDLTKPNKQGWERILLTKNYSSTNSLASFLQWIQTDFLVARPNAHLMTQAYWPNQDKELTFSAVTTDPQGNLTSFRSMYRSGATIKRNQHTFTSKCP